MQGRDGSASRRERNSAKQTRLGGSSFPNLGRASHPDGIRPAQAPHHANPSERSVDEFPLRTANSLPFACTFRECGHRCSFESDDHMQQHAPDNELLPDIRSNILVAPLTKECVLLALAGRGGLGQSVYKPLCQADVSASDNWRSRRDCHPDRGNRPRS